MNNIVIVGGGHVGLALAVDLEIRKKETGFQPHVVLVRDSRHPFGTEPEAQKVDVEDILTGTTTLCRFPNAQIHRMSDAVDNAIAKASMIVVTVPDIPSLRRRVFDWIKSRIPDRNATIALVRGGQGGQIGVVNAWRNDPILRRYNFVLVEDSFYGTRYIDRRIAFKRKRKTNISIFGPHPEMALSLMRRLFCGPSVPSDAHDFVLVRPLDLQFDPLGYIIHLAVTLDEVNLQLTGRGVQYLHYSDGVHEGNADRIETLDKERVLLASFYDAATRSFPDILSEQYGLPKQPSFLQMMKGTKTIYRSLSPSSMADLRASRLIHEDVPALFTMDWLRRQFGDVLPASKTHAENVQAMLRELNVNVAPLREYSDELENMRLSRSEIISQLAYPA